MEGVEMKSEISCREIGHKLGLFSTYHFRSRFIALLCALSASFCSSAVAQTLDDPVTAALGTRHMTSTVADLVELAGGEDQLVEKLLALRTQESPPFVGIRAEKMLLTFAGRPEVQAALEQDVESAQYVGLARTVAVHIDSVSDSNARQALARKVLSRASRESTFSSYARNLKQSTDPEVSRLAKEALSE
jgi:hypothetical protein